MIAQNNPSGQNATDNSAQPAAPSATDQNAPAASAPAAAPDQNAPAANAPAASDNSNSKLPQTGSELPLLGLLGLGTVSAGVWKAYYKK